MIATPPIGLIAVGAPAINLTAERFGTQSRSMLEIAAVMCKRKRTVLFYKGILRSLDIG
jgi:hypothetical protein